LLNLSFWPFTTPGADDQVGLYWAPGMSFRETVSTYAKFYLATSLPFDLSRAAANAILVLVLGRPILRLLDRYRARFMWELEPDPEATGDRDGQRA
jgi:energy-coupling factor transport system substrate-specific component